MNITNNFLSIGKKARSGRKFTQPVTEVLVHWIGTYIQRITTPRDWWEFGSDGTGVAASAHFVVKDEYVIQCLPLDEQGAHSGDARNLYSIGIEVCPMNIEGEFSSQSINTLRDLVRHIQNQLGRNLEINRHFDGVQKKDCPRWYTPYVSGGEDRWQLLKTYLATESYRIPSENEGLSA